MEEKLISQLFRLEVSDQRGNISGFFRGSLFLGWRACLLVFPMYTMRLLS